MPEPVDVAIQKALTDRATAFADAQVPALTIAHPSVVFTPPAAKTGNSFNRWLKLDFIPAPTVSLGVDYAASNQHYGTLQISVFVGFGAGELVPKRIAAAVAAHFKRGPPIDMDGFRIKISDTPKIGGGMKDDPWWMVPVSIPFKCFASSPT